MERIKTRFIKYKMDYAQIWRNESHAIYQVDDWNYEKRKFKTHYELVRIRKANQRIQSGVHYPASEILPSSSKFGIDSWCGNDLNSLGSIYNEWINNDRHEQFATNALSNKSKGNISLDSFSVI